jgi:uncharacterized membrane protein HdeD (DUF308 family)
MRNVTVENGATPPGSSWLKRYYFLRFAVAAVWVALAFAVAKSSPPFAAVMLVAYPAWDALANVIDANRSGGLGHNKSQLLNVIVSMVTAVAVALALGKSNGAVLLVWGAWAVLAGVLQLITAARRWKSYGAQWAMILSGAQSALAGISFIVLARGSAPVAITTVAPYAAFGAFYFFVSALWLTVSDARRSSKRAAA